MEKNDLAMMKAENERLATDLERLKQRVREEITRTQAGVRLDLNLEKCLFCFCFCLVFLSPISSLSFVVYKNLFTEKVCVVLCCVGRMRESSSGQELKIKEVDTRIEREIAELKTSIQASKVRPRPSQKNTYLNS